MPGTRPAQPATMPGTRPSSPVTQAASKPEAGSSQPITEKNSMPEVPQKAAQAPQHVYVDRPELAETFADSLQSVSFDGQSVRLDFCVTRFAEPKQQDKLTGKRYPACRLVLTPGAAVELINHLQRLTAAFAQAGMIKTDASKPGPAPAPPSGKP